MTHETGKDLSPQQNLSWFAVFVTEFIVISVINTFTIIAFARNRHLRKRTTYLIINLTVADLLVGAVTEPMDLYYPQYDPVFSWQHFTVIILYNIFPISSLTNLSLIALERLHATLRPFRHCLIDKWVCSWLVALFLSSVMAVFYCINQWQMCTFGHQPLSLPSLY